MTGEMLDLSMFPCNICADDYTGDNLAQMVWTKAS